MARKPKAKLNAIPAVVEHFQNTDIVDVMRENYGDYAAEVVIGRAIPDVRDGLKPVHRRILYAMKTGGFDWTSQHRKSARIVGDVLGKYHPHGDSSVYDAMTRLTQLWSVTAPLIDGQGNFGSPDGDNPAAMRYTEARLANISRHLLSEINRGTVGWRPNYDGLESEPTVLPAAFPHILVNGGSGIAVGMASSIPPHNLSEVVRGALMRLRNPGSSLEELMEIIPGPDLPTFGRILGNEGITKAYATGRGTVQVEATANFEMDGKTPVIIYTDMPYGIQKPNVLGRINELIKLGKLPEVVSARDESDRKGTRFVVELAQGTDQSNTDLRLKILTDLRTTLSLNFTALDAQGVPREMGLAEILDHWISFRRETVRKRSTFDLRKLRERGRLTLGRLVALTAIDRIVKKIKESPDRVTAIKAICEMSFPSEEFGDLLDLLGTVSQKQRKRFNLTVFQAEDILAMRLQRLTGLERESLENEGREIAAQIVELQAILGSAQKVDDVIRLELEAISLEGAGERRTVIDAGATILRPVDVKTTEPKEDCFVEITAQGLVQKRKKRPDAEEVGAGTIMKTHSHARMVIFTDLGTAYGVDMPKLPNFEEKKEDPRSINGLVGQQLDGAVASILLLDEDNFKDPGDGGSILVFTTMDGFVRRTAASEFSSIPSTGKLAMKIAGKDAPILNVFALNRNETSSGIFLGTAKGKTIRFSLEQVRIFGGRASRGVRAIKLDAEDRIVSSFAVPLSTEDSKACDALEDAWLNGKGSADPEIIQVAATGHLKRTTLHAYRQMNRDGKGVNDKGPAKTIGEVVTFLMVQPDQTSLLLQTGTDEHLALDLADIRRGGRGATGGKPVSKAIGLKISEI